MDLGGVRPPVPDAKLIGQTTSRAMSMSRPERTKESVANEQHDVAPSRLLTMRIEGLREMAVVAMVVVAVNALLTYIVVDAATSPHVRTMFDSLASSLTYNHGLAGGVGRGPHIRIVTLVATV